VLVQRVFGEALAVITLDDDLISGAVPERERIAVDDQQVDQLTVVGGHVERAPVEADVDRGPVQHASASSHGWNTLDHAAEPTAQHTQSTVTSLFDLYPVYTVKLARRAGSTSARPAHDERS